MKKFKLLLLTCFALAWAANLSAQCTQFPPNSAYSMGIAGCNGDTITANFEAWANEVYFADLDAGGNYTFELGGVCNATDWGGVVEITIIEGGTIDFAGGTITGGTSTVSTGCSTTFTATVTGITYFVLTTVGGCGGALVNVDNGTPTVITDSNVPCGTCGADGCEATETYCDCPADCTTCNGANPIFISGYDTGLFALSTTPIVYCGADAGATGAATTMVYVPFVPLGNQPCVDTWGVTTSAGTLYASTIPISPFGTTLDDGFIGIVGLTDADLASSGGMITITFVDSTTTNACTFDLMLDMSTALDASGVLWAGNVADACGVCGDNACEATEDYCSCPSDCTSCVGAEGVFVEGYDTGLFNGSLVPVVYCGIDVGAPDGNSSPPTVYVPFVPFGNQPCVSDWGVTTDFGFLYSSADLDTLGTTLGNGNLGVLGLTDADITGSGGIITLTFTDSTTMNGCTYDLIIDMSMAVDADSMAWAGTAMAACPSCTPPAATFVSYDCTAPSITINVTDLGTPSAGSTTGYVAEVRTASGLIVGDEPLALGSITIMLPDNSQVYDLILKDGINSDCEVGFFNNTLLYGDCRQAAGPGTDCVFVMDEDNLSGGFETDIWTYTPFVLGTSFPLDSLSHAWLGGYGTVNIDSIGQTISIPSSTPAMMHYWVWFRSCADATDVFELTIDGTIVYTLNGADANCGGNWFEISVDISAYADGGTHDLLFTLSEMGSGAGDGDTQIMIDEIMIEACGLLCATDLVLTTTEVGTQTYVADNSITSTDAVVAGENVVYDAGQIICLENDFEAAAEFAAIIGGCPVLLAPNGGNSSAVKTTNLSNISVEKAGQSKKNFAKKASHGNISPEKAGQSKKNFIKKTSPQQNSIKGMRLMKMKAMK